MYRKYYTLRRGKFPDEIILSDKNRKPIEFDSYEEAYEMMVDIYIRSKKADYEHPSGLPVRYGIWETTESEKNSTTRATWD